MKQFFRNNGGLLLVAAVLLAGVLMVGAYILGYDPLSGALELLATPFRAASSAVAGWTQEQYDKSFRYEQAQAEIDALRRRVAELEQDAIAGQEAQRENERMRDLLGLAEQRPELQYRDAAVVRRASSNWTSDLTINRGTSGGVEAGDCVIDQYGHLIGVVTQADLNSSLVTTILDPTLELGGPHRRRRHFEGGLLPHAGGAGPAVLPPRGGPAGDGGSGDHLRPGRGVSPGAGGGHGALPHHRGGRADPVRPGGARGGHRRGAVCVCDCGLRSLMKGAALLCCV